MISVPIWTDRSPERSGQAMHASDPDQVQGGVIVHQAYRFALDPTRRQQGGSHLMWEALGLPTTGVWS